jgi:hypothetical protein
MYFVAKNFSWWRGVIKVRLDFVVSAYHRGKIAVLYEPNISQYTIITSSIELNKNNLYIIDLQQTQSIEFCIEWNQHRAWCETVPPEIAASILSGANVSNWEDGKANGFLAVFPFTELQSPDDSSVEVNVFVSAEDLHVQGPTEINLPLARLLTEAALEEKSPVGVDCVVLNPSSANNDNISDFHFGEECFSFRSLLKRYVTIATPELNSAGLSGDSLSLSGPSIPTPKPQYGASVSDTTLLETIMYAFLGVRGGVKYRVFFRNGRAFIGPNERISVDVREKSTSLSTYALAWSTTKPNTDLKGGVSFIPQTNGGVEFELPFYSPNLFAFSFANDLVGTGNANNDMLTDWNKMFQVLCPADEASTANFVSVDQAIGEDFTFLRFVGTPFYTTPV